MGLFNLKGINFTKDTPRKGAASPYLVNSKYDYNTFRFPEDIGNYDKGHYMVIHINEQIHTKNPGTPSGDLPQIIANRQAYAGAGSTTILQDLGNAGGLVKKVGEFVGGELQNAAVVGDSIASASSKVSDLTSGIRSEADKKFQAMVKNDSGVRTIKRTTDTVALYMPDTLSFTHNQGYSDLSLTGTAAGLITAGSSLADALKGTTDAKQASKKVISNLSPFFANYASKAFGDFGKAAFASSFGMVENPMLELLYQSPKFREFRFDFMFYPRSEREALEVQNILERLRYHQAPEIRKENTSFFLIPPSEFDIKFYYNGKENPNIPKISTCVLETIDIDYAPNGFSAYEVPGQNDATLGGTGMPVGIRLGLQFRETEIMTKDHFQKNTVKPMDWYE